MQSADQMLRKALSPTANERPPGGEAEAPPSLHATSTAKFNSTQLRKRHLSLSSGQDTNIKDGSGEKSETRPAIAPGFPITTATLTPPLGQFVINLLLQLAGIVAAIAFGIFAVESLNVAKQANIEARIANQVAILGICTQVRFETPVYTTKSSQLADAVTE